MAVIEDFFRLEADTLFYFPLQTITSHLQKAVLEAASAALTLLKEEPLMATLHYLRDLLAYGSENLPQSSFGETPLPNREEIHMLVKQLVVQQGEDLTKRVMTGMMYSFPRDCFPDASGVMLAMFQMVPLETTGWLKTTVGMLPEGTVTSSESERLIGSISQ